MALACFGGDVDLVLSKARPTSSVPGRRKVSEGFLLTPLSQPHLGRLGPGNWGGISKGEKKRKTTLYLISIVYLALCSVFHFNVPADSSCYPCGSVLFLN